MFQHWQRPKKPNLARSASEAICPAPNSEEAPVVCEDQTHNPFTEIQILTDHTNIIRFLVSIDEQRFATAADDHLVIVWDVHFGKRIHILDAHSRPITCLSILQENAPNDPILLSAASDKSICVWQVDSGNLLHVLSEHSFTTRAFGVIKNVTDVFYSGGEDLCAWDVNHGKLLQQVKRSAEEDIQIITALDSSYLVTAADKSLVVYERDRNHQVSEVYKLKLHNEKVTHVIWIDESQFASSSLDGTVILWSSETFTSIKFLSLKRRDFQGSSHFYPYSVQHMFALGNKYLVCAMGTGFYIQDIKTDKHMVAVWNAHYSKILHMAFVFDNLLLATTSEDGRIRLWGSLAAVTKASAVSDASAEDGSALVESSAESLLLRFLGVESEEEALCETVELALLGECLGHSGAVHKCLSIGIDGFISCGTDSLVILWKDGVRQEMKRNEIIRDLLYGASSDFP